MTAPLHTDVAIIGAGTAGIRAMSEVRRAGRSFVLIDPGPLGTMCARVGCMPSKIALEAGHLWASRQTMPDYGMSGVEHLRIDTSLTWEKLRQLRQQFAQGAADQTVRVAGDRLLLGRARFVAPTSLEVDLGTHTQRVEAQSVVIATGSRPIIPAAYLPLESQAITTDQLFELTSLPERIGVVGLGAIGLEMGLALSLLGVKVTMLGRGQTLGGMKDPEIDRAAKAFFGRYMTLVLDADVQPQLDHGQILLRHHDQSVPVDAVLLATGRAPTLDHLGLPAIGIPVNAQGVPAFDLNSLQVGEWPIFIAGDANATRSLLHESADEGAIAGYNAAHWPQPQRFHRKVPLAIAFTAPDLVSVGTRWENLDSSSTVIGTDQGSGRAKIMGHSDGVVRIYADRESGRLLGASLFTLHGEHLGHLLAWAIERGETAHQLLEMPFYHPVVEEMLQSALRHIVKQLPPLNNGIVGMRRQ